MLQGGLGTPEYHFPPLFPPGSPCIAPNHTGARSRGSDPYLLPGSEQPLMPNPVLRRFQQAQDDRLVTDRAMRGRVGANGPRQSRHC